MGRVGRGAKGSGWHTHDSSAHLFLLSVRIWGKISFGEQDSAAKKTFVPTARGFGLSVEVFLRKDAGSGGIKEDGMKGETVGKGNWL